MKQIILYLYIIVFFAASVNGAQDSLLQKIKENNSKEGQLKSIVALIDGEESIDWATAMELCKQGTMLAEELKDMKSLLKICANEGMYWTDVSNYGKASELLTQAYGIAVDLQDKKAQIEILRNLGDVARICSEHKLALKYLYDAFALRGGNPISDAFTENRLASVYFELFATNTTGNVFFDSTSVHVKYVPSLARWINYNYLDSTLHFANASLQAGYNQHDDFLITSNLNILGATYEVMGDYKKAHQILYEALKYNALIGSTSGEVEVIRNLGSVLWKEGDRNGAITMLLRADSLLGKSGSKVQQKEIAQKLADFYNQLHDYRSAYRYMKEAHDLVLDIYDNDLKSKLLNAKAEEEHLASEEKLNLEKKINFYGSLVFSVILFFFSILALLLFIRHRALNKINKELHFLNTTIMQQRDELNELNSAKDKFFSIIAHDLRSPIMGLKGFSDVIIEDYKTLTDDAKHDGFFAVNQAIHGVADLTENLLRWAELQLKQKKAVPVYFNFKESSTTIAKVFQTNLLAKEITLTDHIPANCLVYADKDAMYSVLHNLVSNAIKFSPRGSKVTIDCKQENNAVTICITDSGKGIPPEKIDKLFRLDSHVSTKGTDGEKGTGLGLLICKEMIHQNGGSIWAENLERGAAFCFTLPVRPE